jgi:integrase
VLYQHQGRQSALTFDHLKQAEAFQSVIKAHGSARALEMHGINPEPRRRDTPALTVAQWVRHYIDHLTGVEQKTLDDYNRYLRREIEPFFDGIPLVELQKDDIARWVKKLETTPSTKTGRPLAPKTIANLHGFLSGALSAAVGKHIPANPAAKRRLSRTSSDVDEDRGELRMLSRDEFTQLLDSTTEPWRPLLEFLVASGCRWGEATALKPSDVDREAGTVRIRRAWKYDSGGYHIGSPKTKRSRRDISLPASVLDKLDYSHAWLFVGRDGSNWRQAGERPVRYQGFRRRVWDRAVTKSGLDPKPTPHDLRHTCASWMLNAGVPITTVSKHLGHESIKITADIYGHLDRTSAAAAAELMGSLLT